MVAECLELQRRVAKHCCAEPVTALELFLRARNNGSPVTFYDSISTGLPTLDAQLVPFQGLSLGSVTEIVGPAGIGKSQWAMQLCLEAVLPTRNTKNVALACGSAIYIDTEGKASKERLQQMAQHHFHHSQYQNTVWNGDDNHWQETSHIVEILNHITFFSPQSAEELSQSTLAQVEDEIYLRNEETTFPTGHYQEPSAFEEPESLSMAKHEHRPVRLIVLDSIAAPFRRDHKSNKSSGDRSNAILHIAQTLKRLAHQLNLAVVVINQVRSVFSPDDGSLAKNNHGTSFEIEAQNVIAALGMAWHHCVSVRVLLEQEEDATCDDDYASNPRTIRNSLSTRLDVTQRRAIVVKSNLIRTPSIPAYFTITAKGLEALGGTTMEE